MKAPTFFVVSLSILSLWFLTSPFAAVQAAPAQAGPTTVKVSVSAQAGTILTDGEGKTLYLLTADQLNNSTCYDRCAAAWPPLLTDGAPVAGSGASANRLRTLTRTDGGVQVTYNGWPLYYFVRDTQPGTVAGQGVNAFGGSWFVLSPYGGPRHTQSIVTVTQHASLGAILSDPSGRTLYLTTGDHPNKTNCFGDRWPSLLTIALPAAGAGGQSQLLGTTKREEGSTQVTYNGWPLYYFNRDEKPGDMAGQGIQDTCGTWYVLSTAGQAITASVTAPAALPRTGDGGLLPGGQNQSMTMFGMLVALATVLTGTVALLSKRRNA